MDFAKAVRTVRAARGISQKDLAAKSQLGASYVSLLESGKRNPSLAIVEKVAAGLEVPTHVLMLFGATEGDLRFISADGAGRLGTEILAALSAVTSATECRHVRTDKEGAGVLGPIEAVAAVRPRSARKSR